MQPPADTVVPCFSALDCRALLQSSDHVDYSLLDVPPDVPPGSELCSDHPSRALPHGPLSPAPAGTVWSCSSSLCCRALLQPSDHRAPLRSSLSSFSPGAVELCSGKQCRVWLQCPWLSNFAPTKRSSSSAPFIPFEICSAGAVEPYSGGHYRALLLCPLAVEPCSDYAIVELCYNRPC